jgi:acyl-[acyl-carrier-protein]-phospholipid O-acyltransferase / long-chain-fatty-acid--[acyl-carrier-protein] ligase
MREKATATGRAQRQGREGALALMAARRFAPLFWTQFLSAFNDSALKNALVLLVAYRASMPGMLSAEIVIPLAGGLFILPFFLCSATAGQIADQWDKAWLIRLIKLVEIAVMLTTAGFVLIGSVAALLALLFVMGVEAAFFGPLKYAILPDLLAPDELLLGNALIEAGTFVAILLGTIAGVAIVLHHGALLVATMLLGVAFVAWAASLGIPPTGAAAARSPIAWNLFAATARITRDAAADRAPFRAILGISWFWLTGATYLSQFPSYVRFTLGAEAAVVTLFLTIFSVGIALGSLLCNRLLGGRISARLVPWGALAIGLFSVDLWLASPAGSASSHLTPLLRFLTEPENWRIITDLLGMSIASGVFIVPLYALLQALTARERRARAIGANNVINAAAMVLSAAMTMGLLAVGVSVPGLFLLTGAGTVAVGVWFWRILPSFPAPSEEPQQA